METKFAKEVNLQQERERDCRRRVLHGYKQMLRHYREEGIGERSKYAGCIIKQNMIDTLEKRFVQLGGKLENV